MAAIPVIAAGDVEDRLDWLAMTGALAEGHRRHRPALADLLLRRGEDTLLTRSAWVDGLGAATNSVTVVPANPGRGLPSVNGALLLFEDATGAVEAIVDSALVTRWKTAADSLLGARLLARPDARRLLILGAGSVAASLVDAYRAGFPDLAVSIWNRTPEAARRLAAAKAAEAVEDLPAAVAEADIVATATMATEPVLHGAWLRPGQHLDLIGAYRADMREADDDCLRRARIFVDSRDTTLDHIGELKDPLTRGVISRDRVLGDLHDLVAGRVGRRAPDEITLFKNGGGAHLDLMTGRAILAAWRAAS
ncbi:ornithine cyclodeaminase family protein [Amaricoccus sp.]|uniref:ornithine cyclodeaminase family protein n=1 Tax=Amaricoccus sp. TaxID=1872485 RepID=UPI0025C516DF|nr:NAD(P)-binding domain-containing protein [Amaricoccus sp.]